MIIFNETKCSRCGVFNKPCIPKKEYPNFCDHCAKVIEREKEKKQLQDKSKE